MSLLPTSGGTLSVSGTGSSADVTAIACNAMTGAHSEYTNFSFNSLAVIGGVVYGATVTGLFALTGEDDAGTAIAAAVLSGLTDFATERNPGIGLKQKRIDSVITNARTDEAMSIRVRAEETTDYLYSRPRSTSQDGMAAVRTKVGRGLEARNWQFGFNNVDGADFMVDSMEVTPVILSRSV